MKSRLPIGSTDSSRSQAGFSLVEVLVSIGILLVVVLASTSASVQVKHNYWYEQRRLQAMTLAESLTEELLLRSKTDPVLAEGTHSRKYDFAGKPMASTDMSPALFEAFWTIKYDEPMTDTFKIDLRMQWADRNTTRSVALVTARIFDP